MTKNKIRFLVTLAILLAVFVAISFAVPFEKNATFWLSFAFGVLALAVQLYAWPVAFARESPRSKFYGFPVARIATLYLIAQLVLSLGFMALAKWLPAWVGVLVFGLLLAGAAIGFIAADATRDEVERQDAAHKADVATMHALQSKTAFLAGQCEEPETKKALQKLADSFRYSDPVSSDALKDAEANLSALVDELQSAVLEKDNAAAGALCAKIEAALADRNRLCRLNKHR
jgi:hypothetical protein